MRRPTAARTEPDLSAARRDRLVAHAAACRKALARGAARPPLPDDLRNLRDADLRGACLVGAYLWDADLRDADLRGACLWDADFSCADLRGADLRGAHLEGARYGGSIAVRHETTRYRCWTLGPWLVYGCETHRADDDAAWRAAHHRHSEPSAAQECEAIRAAARKAVRP